MTIEMLAILAPIFALVVVGAYSFFEFRRLGDAADIETNERGLPPASSSGSWDRRAEPNEGGTRNFPAVNAELDRVEAQALASAKEYFANAERYVAELEKLQKTEEASVAKQLFGSVEVLRIESDRTMKRIVQLLLSFSAGARPR
jgi:hypothetical protein